MVPPGAVHVRFKEAKKAARLLNVDYADAVTGFQFKGRKGTAVVEGIIVASDFADAIDAILDGFAYARDEVLEKQRSDEALRLWKRFLVGLRVVERLKGYKGAEEVEQEERLVDEQLQREIEEEMVQYSDRAHEDSGGGFFVDQDDDQPAMPTARSHQYIEQDYGGGFMPDDEGGEETVQSPNGKPSLFGLEHLDIPPSKQRIEDGGGGFPADNKDDEPPLPFRTTSNVTGSHGVADDMLLREVQMQSPTPPRDKTTAANNEHEDRTHGTETRDFAASQPVPDPMDIDNSPIPRREAEMNETHTELAILAPSKTTESQIETQSTVNMAETQSTIQATQTQTEVLPETQTTIPTSQEPSSSRLRAQLEPPNKEEGGQFMVSQSQERSMDAGSEDEMDSLASEDPEDEDAEPEWLL